MNASNANANDTALTNNTEVSAFLSLTNTPILLDQVQTPAERLQARRDFQENYPASFASSGLARI